MNAHPPHSPVESLRTRDEVTSPETDDPDARPARDKSAALPGTELLVALRGILLWSGGATGRGRRYLLIGVLGIAVIWGLTTAYIVLTPPSWRSHFSLILPGAGVGTSVNLESIGQASSNAPSPFAGTSISPTVNYKEILTSQVVLLAAAETLDLSHKTLGKPRVKLVDQTQLIHASIDAGTPEEAQRRLGAVLTAFQIQLDSLRTDESQKREAGYRRSMAGFEAGVRRARAGILAFQTRTGLISPDQFTASVTQLANLRVDLGETRTERVRLERKAEALAEQLGVAPQVAIDAFSLTSDPAFQALREVHAEASASLAGHATKWGPNHAMVRAERARRAAARDDMKARAEVLLGRPITDLDRLVSLTSGADRTVLLRELVSLTVEANGLASGEQALSDRIAALAAEVTRRTDDAARLEDLLRDLQVSEAVFASALARVDSGKADAFKAYPLVQVLEEPTLPENPSAPRKTLAVAGAVLGSLFLMTCLLVLWIRQPILHKLLRAEPS
ncbi:GumC family protein [Roseospira visakhapatnamensis]|uniref:Uncharacterized protein involved in exopolysaccharide biosynthesis n=1 Tax=Roseospira visakhapatnamensis TaxID=390880 RepID=A0A7W6W9B0_9PROT|nr:hypothetical protein [Roseospira visakhapatnamensis]MBB4265296.1 uncharacterized protein involved in exopolysaccharide biosynthesis [Roseospira visakhapatnamensis]